MIKYRSNRINRSNWWSLITPHHPSWPLTIYLANTYLSHINHPHPSTPLASHKHHPIILHHTQQHINTHQIGPNTSIYLPSHKSPTHTLTHKYRSNRSKTGQIGLCCESVNFYSTLFDPSWGISKNQLWGTKSYDSCWGGQGYWQRAAGYSTARAARITKPANSVWWIRGLVPPIRGYMALTARQGY
jgi:hypothetical protein